MSKFNECSKIVHQQAFARAIAVESSKKSVSETIDIDNMSEEGGIEGGREREGGR